MMGQRRMHGNRWLSQTSLHSSAYVARSLQRLATVAALRAQSAHDPRAAYAHAARLFGFVDACLAALGSPRDTLYDRQEYERAMAVLCNAMSSDQLAKLMNEGAAMSEEQVDRRSPGGAI